MSEPTLDDAGIEGLSHHVLVSEQFRLVLFTIPKVGCTQLIQLMRRLIGATDWRDNPHYTPDRPFLRGMGGRRIGEILRDPTFTRAVVLRDPAERLLSAYLDKFIEKGGYAQDIFGFPGRGMAFDDFLTLVLDPNRDPQRPTGLHAATDPHWRPQHLVGSLGELSPTLDSVGDFTEIGAWTETLLRRVGAWEPFGVTGWGADGALSIFESNTSPHQTRARERMKEFYTPESLERVYDAYTDDIALASSSGLDLVKHRQLFSQHQPGRGAH